MQPHLYLLALCAALALSASPAGAGERIELTLDSGGVIQGVELDRNPERLVIDLGFQVLEIPTESIRAQRSLTETTEHSRQQGFYREASGLSRLSVKENMARCAEAVLSIHTPSGLGSGFAIHPSGYVVTNHHVIDGENRLTVTLFEPTDKELRPIVFEKVRIVALNPLYDLALLKIEDIGERRLPTVPLGDASRLVQGETVFGIGSPLGFDRTVSRGIVSLKNRLIDNQLYIQSTAQINPGNSGGPLFNLYGEVVGVNNMKIGSIGIEGLSFAIPAHTLKMFLDNADAFAFDARNPNNGYRYNDPPDPYREPPNTPDS